MAEPCILCNSSTVFPIKFLNPAKMPMNRQLMRCRNCDLIFVPEIFHLSPQDEATRYRLHENTLSNEGYVRMFSEKIALIRQYCPDVYSVLDYGCGHEPVLAELMKRDGFECDFYDPYFFPELPEGSYDLVIATEVFEHFRDVRIELCRIRSLLNPGGFLAVMTSFHDTVRDVESWWYITDPTHVCFFGVRTFEWIAEEYGLKIVYMNRKNFIILQADKYIADLIHRLKA